MVEGQLRTGVPVVLVFPYLNIVPEPLRRRINIFAAIAIDRPIRRIFGQRNFRVDQLRLLAGIISGHPGSLIGHPRGVPIGRRCHGGCRGTSSERIAMKIMAQFTNRMHGSAIAVARQARGEAFSS